MAKYNNIKGCNCWDCRWARRKGHQMKSSAHQDKHRWARRKDRHQTKNILSKGNDEIPIISTGHA